MQPGAWVDFFRQSTTARNLPMCRWDSTTKTTSTQDLIARLSDLFTAVPWRGSGAPPER